MNALHIGLDLGKNWFHLVGLDTHGRAVLQKKTSRTHLVNTFAQLPKAVVGMEACSGAHYFAARIRELGHEVRLIPGQFVKPYRKAQKNDFNDAEAIAEAVSRANMRFSRARCMEELELQAIHRARDRIVRDRTAQGNQIRAFLLEAGIAIRQGRAYLARRVPDILTDGTGITPRLRRLIAALWEHYQELGRIERALTRELEEVAKDSLACQRLLTIPGIGPVTATALVSAVGDAKHSGAAATWPPGSVWCRASSAPAASRSCSVSAKAAIHTFARCLSMEPDPPWRGGGTGTTACFAGLKPCALACIGTLPSWHSPTRWRVSAGRCSQKRRYLTPPNPTVFVLPHLPVCRRKDR